MSRLWYWERSVTVALSIDRAVLERSVPTNHGMYITDAYRIDGIQVEIIKEPVTVKSSFTSDKPLWHTAVLTNLPVGAPVSCYEDADNCIAIIEAVIAGLSLSCIVTIFLCWKKPQTLFLSYKAGEGIRNELITIQH